MKKILISASVAAALAGFIAPAAHAGSVAANFNVTVNLTSKCTIAGAAQVVDFGTYTSFQAAAATSTTNAVFSLTCTRTLTAPVATTYDTVSAGNSTAAGVGVVAGLQYALSALVGGRVAGTAASSGSTGSGDTFPLTVSGTMPAGQAGTCAGASCAGSDPRTLTITF